MVNWMLDFCFVVVETMKSAKNIWEPVIENIIILGILMADTSLNNKKCKFLAKYVTFLCYSI